MAINIFSAIMMSPRSVALPLLLTALPALVAAGCNKVPLLAPSGSKIVITTTATALPINGSADIIAQILEAAGTPPQDGTLVTFIATLGTVQPSEAETSGGRVRVKFIAGTTSGTATIIATSGGATPVTVGTTTGTSTTSGSDTVKIAIGAAAVAGISMTAGPTTLPAIGGTATITAITRDSSGNPLPGVPVGFTTDAGTLTSSLVVTDQDGAARTQLNTTSTATVKATAGTSVTSGTTTTAVTGEVKVVVTLGPTISLGAITPNPAIAGQPVSLVVTAAAASATSAPIRDVVVAWGDGTTTSAGTGGSTVVHTYETTGIFSVTATATDVSGNASTAQTSIQVNRVPKPVVGISATQSTTNPQTFTFTITATATAPDTIRNNFLEFGDGQSADLGSGTTATHKYEVGAGAKTAKVTTTTANGATGTASAVIVVP